MNKPASSLPRLGSLSFAQRTYFKSRMSIRKTVTAIGSFWLIYPYIKYCFCSLFERRSKNMSIPGRIHFGRILVICACSAHCSCGDLYRILAIIDWVGVAVQNVERSRTSKVSGSWRRLARRYGPRLARLECISGPGCRSTSFWVLFMDFLHAWQRLTV